MEVWGDCMDANLWGLSVLVSILLLTAGCYEPGQIQGNASCTNQMVPNSYLVRWNGQVPQEYTKYKLHPNSLVTRFSGTTKDIVEKTVLAKHNNEFLVAEPEYQITNLNSEAQQAAVAPGTIQPSDSWGQQDIEASAAWSYLNEKGDGVLVAVVDSGIDVNHPLLKSQISGGYSFIGSPTDLSDGAYHGSHVSGIIAGQPGPNNFSGIAPNARIMPLKFIDSTGAGNVGDAITAIVYANAQGAKVINASWGGAECSASLQQEIAAVTQAGTVFVNAAGNSSSDLSIAPEYPAVYQAPGKITVASYDPSGNISSFSNFGMLVDLAAPGNGIYSTLPPPAGSTVEGNMGVESGTSMATPFVSGVAALLFAAKPGASPVQIANAINGGVVPGHIGVRTGGHVDAYLAAQYLMSH
jgi:subtilisin family serine protease